jgi:hypothetical protein
MRVERVEAASRDRQEAGADAGLGYHAQAAVGVAGAGLRGEGICDG